MGLTPPTLTHEDYVRIRQIRSTWHSQNEEISPEYSNLSCDSHKEVLDKLFAKYSNMNIINDINQNENNEIMDIKF